MGKVKLILIFSTLFCVLSLRSYSQFDGIAIKDSTYIATFEHFLAPMKVINGDTMHFAKRDTNFYSFNWIKNGSHNEPFSLLANIPSNSLYFKHIFKNEDTYTIDLEIINDTAGTSYYTSRTISVQDPLEVPNVFTPNGDPENDLFVVKSNGNPDDKLSLTIYSRNGELIYEQTARVVYWDGKLASGNEASEGVYYYIITSGGSSNTPARIKKGFFHLFR